MDRSTLEAAYRGKKVFVTGHTGFKGSWLTLMLHQLGATVKGYALAPETDKDLYVQIKGDELCESVIHDIRDRERVRKEILSFEPDFIFHMAAQPLVRYSYEQPVDTIEVNVTGTANVLDALRFMEKCCAAVMVTTDKVYHNLEKDYHYNEADRLGGCDPYSASKAAAEIIISSYRDSFFNTKNYVHHKKGIAVARAGNVIGGGDRAKDRIIPDIIRGLENNEQIILRNPAAVRPWQHVLEPLTGYLILGEKLMNAPQLYADAWNFGPENSDTLDVASLSQIALDAWGSGNFSVTANTHQPHEAGLLQLDITKAKDKLGWRPRFNSSTAIRETIKWYKESGDNARAYTEEQIKNYLATS